MRPSRSSELYQIAFRAMLFSILLFLVSVSLVCGAVVAFLSQSAGLCAGAGLLAAAAFYAAFLQAHKATTNGLNAEREERLEWGRSFRPRL